MHQPRPLPPAFRRCHQVHRQPPIVPRDQQPPVANRPVPLAAGAARGERPVAPKHHRPVLVADSMVLEPPTVDRRNRDATGVRDGRRSLPGRNIDDAPGRRKSLKADMVL